MPFLVSTSPSGSNSRLTIRRMTSRGVKWSPASSLACFVEPPDQLLEDVAHLDVGHHVGVQVDLAELRDDQVQPVGLVELGDVLLEAEVLDDLAGPGGEALDVVGQVGGDVVGIALEFLEVELAGVVERLPGHPVEDRLQVLDLAALERSEPWPAPSPWSAPARSPAAAARSAAASRRRTGRAVRARAAGRPRSR